MLSYELWDMVLRYAEASITVSELEEWLVPREPDIMRDPHLADADVVAAIHLGLAEMSEGLRTEDDLRNYLRELIAEYPVVAAFHAPSEFEIRTGTSTQDLLSMQVTNASEFMRVEVQ